MCWRLLVATKRVHHHSLVGMDVLVGRTLTLKWYPIGWNHNYPRSVLNQWILQAWWELDNRIAPGMEVSFISRFDFQSIVGKSVRLMSLKILHQYFIACSGRMCRMPSSIYNIQQPSIPLSSQSHTMRRLDYTHDVPPLGCQSDAIKLFIGNIPKSYTAENLRPLFDQIGTVVELVVVRDKLTDESKGSAFVWYQSRCEAERSIGELHLRWSLSPMNYLALEMALLFPQQFGRQKKAMGYDNGMMISWLILFNLDFRHILHDPTGEQDRPLVVRRANPKAPPLLLQAAAVMPQSHIPPAQSHIHYPHQSAMMDSSLDFPEHLKGSFVPGVCITSLSSISGSKYIEYVAEFVFCADAQCGSEPIDINQQIVEWIQQHDHAAVQQSKESVWYEWPTCPFDTFRPSFIAGWFFGSWSTWSAQHCTNGESSTLSSRFFWFWSKWWGLKVNLSVWMRIQLNDSDCTWWYLFRSGWSSNYHCVSVL